MSFVAFSLPDSGVVAGYYSAANITVDEKGIVTFAENGGGGGGGGIPIPANNSGDNVDISAIDPTGQIYLNAAAVNISQGLIVSNAITVNNAVNAGSFVLGNLSSITANGTGLTVAAHSNAPATLQGGPGNGVFGGDVVLAPGNDAFGGDGGNTQIKVGTGANIGKIKVLADSGSVAVANNGQVVTVGVVGPGSSAVSIKAWLPITVDGVDYLMPLFGH